MLDRAVEQIGDGGEVDVRVRAHVHPLAGIEPRRPELVDEDEWPDHRPLAARQRPPHLERAEVVGDRRDGLLDHYSSGSVALIDNAWTRSEHYPVRNSLQYIKIEGLERLVSAFVL